MNLVIKKLLLPKYYALLRTARAAGLLRKPIVKFCVSTVNKYAEKTIPLLVQSLVANGIKSDDIYVFEGGHHTPSYAFSTHHHYLITHNSFDFTALIEVANAPVKTDYWFLLHDTCLIDKNFKKLVFNIPHFFPQAMPVKHYPSMSIGAYRKDYLASKGELLNKYRHVGNEREELLRAKERAIASEDILFRQSKRPMVYNGWMLNPEGRYERPDAPVPSFYNNRICEYFPQVGLYKFKANYHLVQTRTIEL